MAACAEMVDLDRLEETSRPTSPSKQDQLNSDQVPQGFFQLGLGKFKGQKFHNLPASWFSAELSLY